MLLTETITNSTSSILRRRTAQENKQSAEAYASALAQLNSVSETLKATLKCATLLKEKKIVSQPLILSQTRDELIECINNCGKGLYDGTLTNDMVAVLKTKSETVAGQIQIVWKDAATKYAEGTQGYLSVIGGISNNPKKADELLEMIRKLTNGNLSVNAIDSLIENVSRAKAITDSFSLNEDIERFLKKVSTRQATILDLTPEVQKWLSEQCLSSKFKISF